MEMHNIYECPQCNNKLTLPDEMTESDQMEIVMVCRSGRKIDAILLIRSKYNLGLAESSLLVRHISDPKDHCANCKNRLPETGVTFCPSCSGLNLNW